jgi:outer membrane immunogenic protein
MKKLALAVSVLAISAVSASAADMAPLYTKAPAFVPEVYNWTGFYVGGDVGGFGDSQSATTNPFPSPGFGAPPVVGTGLAGFGNLPTFHGLGSSGVLGGGYVGYNWQTSTNFLVGVEADIDGLNRSVSNSQTVLSTFFAGSSPAFNMLFSASNNWLASARVRLGWVMGKGLIYVTGGAAWTNTSYTATATGLTGVASNLSGVNVTTSWSNTQTGYAIGSGGEYMLTSNWILRAEYVHYGFGGSSSTLPLVGTFATSSCAPGKCNWALGAGHQNFDTGIIGISYKFGSPIVAKY